MSLEGSRGIPDYQRISHTAAQEADQENPGNGEARRTLLPQANPEYSNEWDVD